MSSNDILPMRRVVFHDQNWCVYYELMVAYQREHGHCEVPKNNELLGDWAVRQQTINRKNTLRIDRKNLLDKIGFRWKEARRNRHVGTDSISRDQKWNQQYRKLVAYERELGHCDVPHRWKDDKSLGNWISKQRSRPIR
jgi:hypothetical protein